MTLLNNDVDHYAIRCMIITNIDLSDILINSRYIECE